MTTNRREYMREYIRRWRYQHRRGVGKNNFVKSPITDVELTARRALIPIDTRSLTARLCGDPIPGDRRARP